jgi:hypothetical protein
VALLLHLMAVAIPPMSVPPASELQTGLAWLVSPYTEALGVHHGYRFFAPNPGPSDMMRVEIVGRDGERLPDLIYPDLKKQWPRLLYHRHFMLTSRLSAAPLDPTGYAYAESYAQHLHALHDAQEVRIYRRLHRLPTADQVRSRLRLTDDSLFNVPYHSLIGTWREARGLDPEKAPALLEIRRDEQASWQGKPFGMTMPSDWYWRVGEIPGQFVFESTETSQTMKAEWSPERPHELWCRYEWKDGRVQPLLLTREPPPLVVYRRKQT